MAAAVAAGLSVATLPGPAPALAATPTFAHRYSAQGWTDVSQTGAAVVACPEPACQDGSDLTLTRSWVDVDQDPSTVNSSRAVLTIPPRADVDWVGLYWAGDRGTRADAGAPRCDAAPQAGTPPTLPPDEDKANQVKVGVNDKPYTVATANSLIDLTGPNGGTGFQAYVDITSLVRPAARATDPTEVRLTVAELQVASGPGCGGGWIALLAYSYRDGPDKTYAPDYRSIGVYDGGLVLADWQTQQVQLDGVPAASQDGPQPRLLSSLFGSGQALGSAPLTFGGSAVDRAGTGVTVATLGLGYQQARSPVPAGAVKPGATVGFTAMRGGFVSGVVTLSTPLPVKVKLSVATSIDPPAATVGSAATLTVTLTNEADIPATGVKVAVELPPGLRLTATTPGYDNGFWSPEPVAPRGSATLSLPVLIGDAGALISTARISGSDLPNENPPGLTSSATVTATLSPGPVATTQAQESVIGAQPWSLPEVAPAILFGIGLFLLGLLLLSLVVVRHRARLR